MAITKIRIRVGSVEVDYEGSESFLNKQLPALIEKLSTVAGHLPKSESEPDDSDNELLKGNPGPLPKFLNSKNANSSAVRKFLATAEWFHRKGSKSIKTGDVTKALRDSHQTKLGNPSKCLSDNVSKGFCEKVGKEFFVTQDGRKVLG